ncbi:hypothetical protein BDQ17DRAFT_1409139 [Cyathus striatus]|nr:hypothetical protein BDQ17DRAFT_1409139 [Cyathus striatus]
MIVPVAFLSMLFSSQNREQDPEKDAGRDDDAGNLDDSLRTSSNPKKHGGHFNHDMLRRPNTSSQINSSSGLRRSTTFLQRIKSTVYPRLPFTSPNYRVLPIISGIFIPFSVLLAIPGLTGHWYIRTEDNKTVEIRPNPRSLDIAMGFSMASAAIATTALLVRFSERKVKLMTLICVFFLTIHDIINIVTVVSFGVIHRFDDGFTYGQSFWMTVCSSIVSLVTNITLIIDYLRIQDIATSGSGLTKKQRSLLVSIILMLCYIALGALVHSKLLDLSFIDALYFTVASIETIGFGDITPITVGSRIFTCSYAVLGIINLALTVNLIRDALLEAIQFRLQKRLHSARLNERQQRINDRWTDAVKWRLKSSKRPIWVKNVDDTPPRWSSKCARWIRLTLGICNHPSKKKHHTLRKGRVPPGMHLNIESLTMPELAAAAFETGVPLEKLLPPGFELPTGTEARLGIFHGPLRTLTHSRVGHMAAFIGRVGIAVAMGMSEEDILKWNLNNKRDESPLSSNPEENSEISNSKVEEGKELEDMEEVEEDIVEEVENEEKREFYAHLSFAWTVFIIFWMIGSAIFMKTEGWPFGSAMYFCFVAFTTLGYGDFSPKTPAGRSVFVVWALLGVGTMTILISIIQEAYVARYKKVIHTEALEEAVEVYHEELSEKARGKRKLNIEVPSFGLDSDANPVTLEGTTAVNASFPLSAGTSTQEDLSRKKLDNLAVQIDKHTGYLRQLVTLSESPSISKSLTGVQEFNSILLQVPRTESLRRRVNVPGALGDSDSRQVFINLAIESIINNISSLTQEAVSGQAY